MAALIAARSGLADGSDPDGEVRGHGTIKQNSGLEQLCLFQCFDCESLAKETKPLFSEFYLLD